MAQRISSLEVVADAVRRERDIQLRHFEALDTKSGIVLGFSGALVALGGGRGAVATVARLLVAAAALMSLWSFLPRRYPVLEARTLRDEYLRADPSFTQLHLLDTLVAMVEEAAQMLSAKAFRLRLAIASLVFGIGFMAASMLYE